MLHFMVYRRTVPLPFSTCPPKTLTEMIPWTVSERVLPPSSDDLQKQGVSHISVTAEQVLDSDGQTRFKWMEAGRKELGNLANTGTIEPISPERKDQIKVEARKKGLKYVRNFRPRELLPSSQTSSR